TAPVAAALKAALDWLREGSAALRPLSLASEESVLLVVCEKITASGLKPASQVLAAAGGNLGPAHAIGSAGVTALGPGAWTIRLPAYTERPSFLMVIQGGLHLALPWHSVLRLRLVPAAGLEGGLKGQGVAVLDPL